MQCRAVDAWEVSVPLVEEHRKISPSQNDRLDSITRPQSVSYGSQFPVLLFGAFSLAPQLHIRVVNGIHFVRSDVNEFHSIHQTEEPRLHHETSAKERDPPRPSCRKLLRKGFKNIEERQRRSCH